MTWNDLPLPLLRRIAETTSNHEVLKELCENNFRSVRIYVVHNIHAPPSVLTKLSGDISFLVKSRAEERIKEISLGIVGLIKSMSDLDKLLNEALDL